MKVCKNCGAQLSDEMHFCDHCGMQITGEAEKPYVPMSEEDEIFEDMYSVEDTTTNRRPAGRNKSMLICILSGVVLTVIILCIVIVSQLARNHEVKKISLKDYYDVTFSGYNHEGTAQCMCKENSLTKIVLEKNGINIDSIDSLEMLNSKNLKKALEIEDLLSKIDVDLSKSKDLSNSDVVNVTLTCDKEVQKKLKVTFVDTTFSATVTGLSELTKVDPFKNVTVEFKGISPNLTASIKIDDKASANVKGLKFTLEKKEKIKIGDSVTVTIGDSPESLKKRGFELTQTSKTYKCEKADQYVWDIKSLSEEQLQELKNITMKTIKDEYLKFKEPIEYTDLVYEGAYVITSKAGRDNLVYIVYSTEVTTHPINTRRKGLDHVKYYIPQNYSKVIIKADGTLSKTENQLGGDYLTGETLGSRTLPGYKDEKEMFSQEYVPISKNYDIQVSGNLQKYD